MKLSALLETLDGITKRLEDLPSAPYSFRPALLEMASTLKSLSVQLRHGLLDEWCIAQHERDESRRAAGVLRADLDFTKRELTDAREEIVELQTRLADVKAFRERETARADRCLRNQAEEELALEREITASLSRTVDRLESERDAARLKVDLVVTERDEFRSRIASMARCAVRVMDRAFASDPDAIHAMICNRVPCNQALADDPTVVVDASMVSTGYDLGAVGLINGILEEMGVPKLAYRWSERREDGRHNLLGFEEYQPMARTVAD